MVDNGLMLPVEASSEAVHHADDADGEDEEECFVGGCFHFSGW